PGEVGLQLQDLDVQVQAVLAGLGFRNPLQQQVRPPPGGVAQPQVRGGVLALLEPERRGPEPPSASGSAQSSTYNRRIAPPCRRPLMPPSCGTSPTRAAAAPPLRSSRAGPPGAAPARRRSRGGRTRRPPVGWSGRSPVPARGRGRG